MCACVKDHTEEAIPERCEEFELRYWWIIDFHRAETGTEEEYLSLLQESGQPTNVVVRKAEWNQKQAG